MPSIHLRYDWGPFMDLLSKHTFAGFDRTQWNIFFPHTLERIGELAIHGETLWRQKATEIPGQDGRPLRLNPFVQLNVANYAHSIVAEPADGAESSTLWVIGTREEQAQWIEKGTPSDQHPIDLHSVLAYSHKARQGKHGKYLRIPLQHATTEPRGGRGRFQPTGARLGHGILTSGVVSAMKKKNPYLVVSTYQEPSIHDATRLVERNRYSRNPGRLSMAEIQAINTRAAKHKITSTFAKRIVGLMRTGEQFHGGYLTIRTLSENNKRQDSWRIDEYKPQGVAEAVAKELIASVESGSYFDEAFRADAAHLAQLAGVA